MPTFDAGTVLEQLDWDFTAAGVKAKGTVREPSDAVIGQFLEGIRDLYTKAQNGPLAAAALPADTSPEDMLAALTSLTGAAFVDFMAETAALFSGLCGGSPSRDQILGLPMRVRVHFYAWIQKEVVNPEAVPAAGLAEVRKLPTAAGG
jgi:hypothetical protein